MEQEAVVHIELEPLRLMATAFCDERGHYEINEWQIDIVPIPSPQERAAALALLDILERTAQELT